MKRWKKFIAMGLAVSMTVPSCIPQTLWASEFSAGSVESAADVFEDGAGYETGNESGNKMFDENNSGDEFGTGELKDQEPEQSETEDSVNAGQSAEGYNILLYSDGKLEKTYVIPYADGTNGTAKSAVSTGDESPIGTMLALAAASVLAGGYVLIRRRKKEM